MSCGSSGSTLSLGKSRRSTSTEDIIMAESDIYNDSAEADRELKRLQQQAEQRRAERTARLDGLANDFKAKAEWEEGLANTIGRKVEQAVSAEDHAEIEKLRAEMAEVRVTKSQIRSAWNAERQNGSSETPEEFLARLSPEDARYVRSNPRYFTDQHFRDKANNAAGYLTTVKGIPRGSDEYYREIDRAVGKDGLTDKQIETAKALFNGPDYRAAAEKAGVPWDTYATRLYAKQHQEALAEAREGRSTYGMSEAEQQRQAAGYRPRES
jgi:hypothetical protein